MCCERGLFLRILLLMRAVRRMEVDGELSLRYLDRESVAVTQLHCRGAGFRVDGIGARGYLRTPCNAGGLPAR